MAARAERVEHLHRDVHGEREKRPADEPERAPLARRSRAASLAAAPYAVSCQTTTTDAKISMRESRPKPARATDWARHAAVGTTATPTTFQPSVAYSSQTPRRASAGESVLPVPIPIFIRLLSWRRVVRGHISVQCPHHPGTTGQSIARLSHTT